MVDILTPQITHFQNTIQIKNKQIFFLSSSVVSLKAQIIKKQQKIQHIEAQYRKQVQQLRLKLLRMGNSQADKMENNLIEMRKSYEYKIDHNRNHYEKLIERQKEKYIKEVELCKQKYEGLLTISKREAQSMEDIIAQKNKLYQEILCKCQQEKRNLLIQKSNLNEMVIQYKNQLDTIKASFKKLNCDTQKKGKQQILQIERLKQNQKNNKKKIEQLEQELTTITSKQKQQMLLLENKLYTYKSQSQNYKHQLRNKQKELMSFLSENNQNKKNSILKTININKTNECQHQNYIKQLQTNLRYKQKQNQYLKNKLKQWSNQVGLDLPVKNRLISINKSSQNAYEAYANFRKTLKGLK